MIRRSRAGDQAAPASVARLNAAVSSVTPSPTAPKARTFTSGADDDVPAGVPIASPTPAASVPSAALPCSSVRREGVAPMLKRDLPRNRGSEEVDVSEGPEWSCKRA